MAKVKGALHSDSAGGKFACQMIFRRGKQGAVVTKFYKPGSANPFVPSEAQLFQREKYGQAVEAWRALTSEEKAVFNEQAKSLDLSGWNLFFKQYTPTPPGPTYDFVVSGDISPDATGGYNEDVLNYPDGWNGKPVYARVAGGYNIWWNTNSLAWSISVLVNYDYPDSWNGGGETPVGSYDPFPDGAMSGNPVVAIG